MLTLVNVNFNLICQPSNIDEATENFKIFNYGDEAKEFLILKFFLYSKIIYLGEAYVKQYHVLEKNGGANY